MAHTVAPRKEGGGRGGGIGKSRTAPWPPLLAFASSRVREESAFEAGHYCFSRCGLHGKRAPSWPLAAPPSFSPSVQSAMDVDTLAAEMAELAAIAKKMTAKQKVRKPEDTLCKQKTGTPGEMRRTKKMAEPKEKKGNEHRRQGLKRGSKVATKRRQTSEKSNGKRNRTGTVGDDCIVVGLPKGSRAFASMTEVFVVHCTFP